MATTETIAIAVGSTLAYLVGIGTTWALVPEKWREDGMQAFFASLLWPFIDWRAANVEWVRAKQRLRDRRLRPVIKQRKLDLGQCRRCALPAEPGKRSCAAHLAADVARVMKQKRAA